ncbi:hypothetical protein ABTY61_36520, partial [Kitasatospora sp. NPDC096128]
RRTAPPHDDRSDRRGHRTAQAGPGDRGREGTRPPVTERAHDARSRTGEQRTREPSASNTVRDARSSGNWQQMSLLDTVEERLAPPSAHAAARTASTPNSGPWPKSLRS